MESTNTTNPTPRRGDGSGGNDEQVERIKQAGKDVASDARREVRSRLEAGKDAAAETASDAQHAFDDVGERLAGEGHDTLAQAAYAASERISSLAHYVETHSLDELTQEARRLARRNPALVIAGGIALGFALSRFFKASSAPSYHGGYEPYEDYESYGGGEPYGEAYAGDTYGASGSTDESAPSDGESRHTQSWPEGRYAPGAGQSERDTGRSI